VTLGQRLIEHGLFVATAESLTAGLLSSDLATEPGASGFLLGGVICYQDEVKVHLLGVDPQLIETQTAVDPEVAISLARNVREKLALQSSKDIESVIGVSTTGVAGPGPVGNHAAGTVFLGISSAKGSRAVRLNLQGTRSEIRAATVTSALNAIEDEIQAMFG
jgi:PncC family amidohydrolase